MYAQADKEQNELVSAEWHDVQIVQTENGS